MLRPKVNRHRNRQTSIRALREQLSDLDAARTHDNFTKLLSGFDSAGADFGPYAGVRLIDGGRQQANGDTRHLGTNGGSDFAGNFAKGLEHTPLSMGGLVDPPVYRAFAQQLNAVVGNARSLPIGDEDALDVLDSLQRPEGAGGSRRPYTNALSGVGALTNTIDSIAITVPPAPEFDGELMANEMAELYWMAKVRDVPFADWATDPDITAAEQHLNTLNAGATFTEHHPSDTRGDPTWSKVVDKERTLFRGSAYGVNQGPYVSQFLLRSFRFGTLVVDQLYRATNNGQDFMTSEADWLTVQRLGSSDGGPAPKPPFYEQNPPVLRHISTLRDLTHYVHFDALHEAYFNAALILIDIAAPLNPANPYVREVGTPPRARNLFSQEGFGTFGGPSALVILSEVATRALKSVWHQKWFVHRRLRPEAMGGRIHAANAYGRTELAHASLLKADGERPEGAAFEAVREAMQGTYLLPMAFQEGSPMHPAYGAGHATVAGACVTILKAMFEPEQPLQPLFAARMTPGDSAVDGIAGVADTDAAGALRQYGGADANALTVEGELNKIAGNIAIARNAAGVHYRSDYAKSLVLGEAVAVGLLQELALQVVEVEPTLPVWALPTFAGHWITIDENGSIVRHPDRPAALPAVDRLRAAPATFAA